MATAGPSAPATVANVAAAGRDWTVPGASSTVAEVQFLALDTVSDVLRATAFGFAIPAGATINGITVIAEKTDFLGTSALDLSVRLQKVAAAVGDNKADDLNYWPENPLVELENYGGVADLWGTTWTPAEINASTFGVQISIQNDGGLINTATIIELTITVTYTPLPVSLDASGGSHSRPDGPDPLRRLETFDGEKIGPVV